MNVEVKVEWNGNIVYIEGERVNCLTKTTVIQDDRHHMSKDCEVQAEVYIDTEGEGVEGINGFLPFMKWDFEKEELRTPNGVLVPGATLTDKDESWVWVAFSFENARLA